MQMKVIVLLSSYNGEKFIEEQLESILQQTRIDVKILVRDDGSTDSTPQILKKYKEGNKLDYYSGDNIGWRKSFLQLAQNAEDCEYYAFCDQDDYWMPEKLSVAISELEKLPDGPNLYVSNTYYWKGEIKVISNKRAPNLKRDGCLIWTPGPGCTMVFNKKLLDIVNEHPINNPEIAHDQWFFNIAHIFGHVYYDTNSYILYRQHDNNQLGTTLGFLQRNKLRIKQFKELRNHRYIENMAKQLILCYGDIMSKDKLDSCNELAYYRRDLGSYLFMLFTNKFNNKNFVTTIGLKLRVLLCHL